MKKGILTLAGISLFTVGLSANSVNNITVDAAKVTAGKTAKLTRNAYIYNSKGKLVKKSALKKNKTAKVIKVVKIKGKSYAQIGKNQFVKLSNLSGVEKSKKKSAKSETTKKVITTNTSSYSTKDYKKADAIIPKKDIKLSATLESGKKVSQTLKAGEMYHSPNYEKGTYYVGLGDDGEGSFYTSAKINASDVIPYDYRADKTVNKYVKTYNKYVKKLKGDYSLGLKFKKNTTVYFENDEENEILESYGNISPQKKRTVKKNKIIAVGSDPIERTNVVKYNGEYYYVVGAWEGNEDSASSVIAYIPVNNITFTKVSSSKSLKATYNF